MAHLFTLDEARQLMPEVIARAGEMVAVRADLVELRADLAQGRASRFGGLPEAKAMEARLADILGWFPDHGLEIKGIAPLLLDFPARLSGDRVLLCWLEGERGLGWYHRPEHGFAGRRMIPDGPGQPA